MIEARVAGEIDNPHSAAANLPDDVVMADRAADHYLANHTDCRPDASSARFEPSGRLSIDARVGDRMPGVREGRPPSGFRRDSLLRSDVRRPKSFAIPTSEGLAGCQGRNSQLPDHGGVTVVTIPKWRR